MQWKIIPTFDCYEVSEVGQVRRCRKGIRGGLIGKVMKPYIRTDGYAMYILRKDNKSYHKKSHQLVAETFIGPKPFFKAEVCHRDGSRNNDHYLNLRWGSNLDNKRGMIGHGTSIHGEKHHNAKISEKDVMRIKELFKNGMLQKEISKQFGIRQQQISRIIAGKRWARLKT